jgi:hypothetical protein
LRLRAVQSGRRHSKKSGPLGRILSVLPSNSVEAIPWIC